MDHDDEDHEIVYEPLFIYFLGQIFQPLVVLNIFCNNPTTS